MRLIASAAASRARASDPCSADANSASHSSGGPAYGWPPERGTTRPDGSRAVHVQPGHGGRRFLEMVNDHTGYDCLAGPTAAADHRPLALHALVAVAAASRGEDVHDGSALAADWVMRGHAEGPSCARLAPAREVDPVSLMPAA